MLKLVALVALFAGFCWVGTHLQLGQHTLFGHLRAIAQTKESQELFDGTRASAGPLVDDVRRRIAGVPATPAKEPAAQPVEETDDAPAHKTDHKVEQSKGELARSEAADSAKPDSTKPDSTKLDSTKPDSAKPDKAKRGLAQETLTPSERRHLRRVISAAEGASARQ